MSPLAPLTDRLRGFTDWLMLGGAHAMELAELFEAACAELADAYPLDRVSLNLEVIHPELGGQGMEWRRGAELRRTHAPRGMEENPDYLYSPVRVVDETGQSFRAGIADGDMEMGILRRLWSEGFTDYLIVPLPFRDADRTAAISFATRQPGGFTSENVQELELVARALSPLVEARVMRIIATDLLSVYLGREPGLRVFDGQIRRGDYSSIFAAILFCDLRGFTAFTQANISRTVIARLNDWFGHACAAVEASGGEVLKFMGDGMMAIFPAQEMNPAEACGHALTAAATLEASVNAWNEVRPADVPPLEYGLSLHLGYVAFGNIGGVRRLDFTVVGPAVNQAARMLDLAKQLERQVVVSQAFAGCSGRSFECLGSFDLRGLPKPEMVYAPQI